MDIKTLVTLLDNRLQTLFSARDAAIAQGDIERLNTVDAEIASTQTTVSELRPLIK